MYSQLFDELNNKKPDGVFFMPFSKVHYQSMRITQKDILAHQQYFDVADKLEMQNEIGFCATVFLNLNPVMIFGIVPIWHGVAEAWMIADNTIRKKPYILSKYSKRFIDIVPVSLALHRLQITVRIADKRAVSWARFLGFTEEGILRRYGPDQANYYMMRK
jgi:hypothetical protein